MALPPEHRTPRVEALEAIVAGTPREKLFDFPVLQPPDLQNIGLFIQLFNYIDFNLRRAIETFAHAKMLRDDAAKAYPRIHSSKVASAVQDAVKAMDAEVENIPDTINILTIIERRREVRNLLSHCAARRIPNEDAIVLLTKNESDAKQTGGAYLSSGYVRSAILDLADFRRLIEQMIPIELWLAQKNSEWRKRYVAD